MTSNTSTSQNQPGPSFNLTETLSNCAEHSKPIIYYKTGDANKSFYCYDCLASEYSLSSALKVQHDLPQNFIATPFFRKKYLNELQEIDSLIEIENHQIFCIELRLPLTSLNCNSGGDVD